MLDTAKNLSAYAEPRMTQNARIVKIHQQKLGDKIEEKLREMREE